MLQRPPVRADCQLSLSNAVRRVKFTESVIYSSAPSSVTTPVLSKRVRSRIWWSHGGNCVSPEFNSGEKTVFSSGILSILPQAAVLCQVHLENWIALLIHQMDLMLPAAMLFPLHSLLLCPQTKTRLLINLLAGSGIWSANFVGLFSKSAFLSPHHSD